MNIHEMQNRFYTECGAVYVSRLRTKMYQNISVDFKLGYVDVKSDAIAFCVKTYASVSFIKNRMNIHEMQNRLYTECDAVYVSKLRTKMYQKYKRRFQTRVRRCKIGRDRILCKDICVRFVHQKSHEYT